MNTNELTDQEKSVLLAKAMGWNVQRQPLMETVYHIHVPIGKSSRVVIENLYDPANMALAWRVHLWMLHYEGEHGDQRFAYSVPMPYTDWWIEKYPWFQADAQRLWLDKVLELAIEAGIVGVDDEEK